MSDEDNKVIKRPLKVFISYSKEDDNIRNELEKHLAPLKDNGSIEIWHDGVILAGDKTDKTIKANLRIADIILCLISPDFLTNVYIIEEELPLMLERENEGKTKIIPVILRPCAWEGTKIANFQPLLKDKPLTSHDNKDAAFMEIYEGLERVMEAVWLNSEVKAS